MLSRIAVQYLTLIFHQHTEAKDVITSKEHTTDYPFYAITIITSKAGLKVKLKVTL
jgi:hypothetical protein